MREGLRTKRLSVAPNKTLVLRPQAGDRGLLELSGAYGLHYSARLVGSNGSGVELPVITAEIMGGEDEVLVVQGLQGAGSRITDLVVMNLGQTSADCSASVVRTDGSNALEPMEVSLLPLSHLVFANLFRGLPSGITDARAEVTCSNEFYAYALTADRTTGALTLANPSQSSDSLDAVFEELSKAETVCSSGKTVCSMPGQVHIATRATPTRAISMTPPAGTYKSMRGHVEVKVDGWNPINVQGAHGTLYVVINKNKYLLGSVFLRGPGKNNVTLRHGVCPGGCAKSKVERPLVAEQGTTYIFDYVYNVGTKITDLRVTHNGKLIAQIQDKPNVNNIFINTGDKVVIGLSNPGVRTRPEPASLGWTYSNLKVEFFR